VLVYDKCQAIMCYSISCTGILKIVLVLGLVLYTIPHHVPVYAHGPNFRLNFPQARIWPTYFPSRRISI